MNSETAGGNKVSHLNLGNQLQGGPAWKYWPQHMSSYSKIKKNYFLAQSFGWVLLQENADGGDDLMFMWRMIPPWQLSPFPTCAWRFTKPPQNRGLHWKCVSIDFLQPTCKCGPSLRPSGELDGDNYNNILTTQIFEGLKAESGGNRLNRHSLVSLP